MKLKTFNQLKKILNRTFSENDNEALVSLRMANKILKEEGIDWTKFLDKLVTIDGPQVEEFHDTSIDKEKEMRNAAIDRMFKAVRDKVSNDFIEDIFEQWEKRRHLSDLQVGALRKFYDRVDS